jgi:hypothetical protein
MDNDDDGNVQSLLLNVGLPQEATNQPKDKKGYG